MNSPDPQAQVSAATPAMRLRDLIAGFVLSRAVYAAASLDVADLLAQSPADAQSLARARGADPGALYRVLRALASVGVFAEDESGKFSNTPMSELLRSDVPGSLRALSLMYGDDDIWAAVALSRWRTKQALVRTVEMLRETGELLGDLGPGAQQALPRGDCPPGGDARYQEGHEKRGARRQGEAVEAGG
jgi:hypothetical protein